MSNYNPHHLLIVLDLDFQKIYVTECIPVGRALVCVDIIIGTTHMRVSLEKGRKVGLLNP